MLPGLRDHHEHRVGQGPSAKVQKLEGLVEASRVGTARITDREDPVDGAQHLGIDHGFAGAHPVLVTADRVDLAIVGNHAVGVGQRPGREGVRRETGVDHRNGGLHFGILQVKVEFPQLRGGQHAFIHNGPGGQRGEIDGVLARSSTSTLATEFAFGAFADEPHGAVQVNALEGGAVILGSRNKNLVEQRHRVPGHGADG